MSQAWRAGVILNVDVSLVAKFDLIMLHLNVLGVV